MARRHLRWLAVAIFVANYLFGGLPSVVPGMEGPYQRARFFSYDLVHQLRAALTKRGILRRAMAPEVQVVHVDEAALNAYGRWPWPRQRVAELVDTLNRAGAVAVGMDVLFKEPSRGPVHDLRVALEGRENLPERLVRLRKALDELREPGADEVAVGWDLDAKALEQAWLLDEEGGDGVLAQTLAQSQNVVLGTALEYIAETEGGNNWLRPGPDTDPPEEAIELILAKDPELDRERLVREWRKGFFPVRFFEQFEAMPLVRIAGVAGKPIQQQGTGGTSSQLALGRAQIPLPDGTPARNILLPRGYLLRHAAMAGFMNDDPSLDGTVRSIPLTRTIGKYPLPSLGLATLAVYHRAQLELWLTAELQPDRVLVVKGEGAERQVIHDFACDSFASVWLNPYPAKVGEDTPYPHLDGISAAQVMDVATGKGDLEALKAAVDGRAVFVGVSALGLTDIRYDTLGAQAPGVMNHATLLANLIHGEALQYQDREFLVTQVAIALMLVLFSFLAPRVSPGQALVFLVLLVAASMGGCAAAFSQNSALIPLDLIAPVALYFVLAMIYLNRFENQDKAWIDQMFKRYVSPDYVEQLKANKGELDLSGREAEITAFFSDLAGFSTFSERFAADRLFTFLGEYLGEMSDILDRHGGTLDKFEGDAVVAFFGAPIPMKDHAARACLASLDMLERLKQLNEKWERGDDYPELKALAVERGRWVPIKSRIGLNTGVCAIGHLGTHERGNYTMMGDNVNLAARLEGTCKLYDISLCVGENTWEQVRGKVEGRELDLVKVMGKTVPTRIFEVMAKVGGLTEKQEEFLFKYGFAMEAYRQRSFAEALRRFEAAKELEPWDWVTQIYIDRCQRYIATPPDPDWDGVTALQTK